MTLVALAEVLLAVWLALAVVYQVAAQVTLRRFLSRPPRRPAGPLPSATILTPLGRGAAHLEENLARLCAAGAPVVAGLGNGGGDVLAAARRVRERAAAGALTLVTGRRPSGSNRKIATLIPMMSEARGEIIIFADADIGVPEGYLEAVLAPFSDPGVGMVTCPYRSVGEDTAAARVDAVLTNTTFLPSVALAERVEGVRFALGATVAIRRVALEAIGGLEPLLEVLADDWAMADRVLRKGHSVVLAPLLLDHHIGEPGWADVWHRHLRWARTMRALRPSGYAGTLVAHGCVPALGFAILAGRSGGAAPALAAWALARVGTVLLNARRTGSGLLDVVLLPFADLLALALYVGGHCGRTVRWGESRLRVGRQGAILASSPLDGGAPQTDYGA